MKAQYSSNNRWKFL